MHRIGADEEVQITAAGCDGANGCWFRRDSAARPR
jgi:hypothetical protein